MPAVPPLVPPLVPFGRIQHRLARLWDPFSRNPHIGIFGLTGSGKSHLIRYGILPLRGCSRVVVIDSKSGRDTVWSGYGEPVAELPPAFCRSGDAARWRVIVDRRAAKAQLRRVFDQIRDEGHCVLVIDESRSITEREQIGLGSALENLVLEGRGLGITLIMGAQSTAWTVSALRDQPATLFVGQAGAGISASLAALAGYGAELAHTLRVLPARRWLYRDVLEGPAILALTDAPPGIAE